MIDNWTEHAPIEDSGTITLAAGQKYDIVMEYYEQAWGAIATLSWSSASTSKQIIPQEKLYHTLAPQEPPTIITQPQDVSVNIGETATFSVSAAGAVLSYQWHKNETIISEATTSSYTTPPAATDDDGAVFSVVITNSYGSVASNDAILSVIVVDTGNGLQGEYYNNMDLTDLTLVRADSNINFNWSGGSPDAGIAADTFSVRWSGQVAAQYDEIYTFYTVSDDGVRLWVNGQLLIDNWTEHAPIEDSGTITLAAGQKHNIVMEYYEQAWGAIARLSWSSASTSKQIISQASLYHTPAAQEAMVITTQPEDVSINVGETATFSVSATGSVPLNYQWYENGVAIDGATRSSYTTPPLLFKEESTPYSVDVTNAYGQETSSATLDIVSSDAYVANSVLPEQNFYFNGARYLAVGRNGKIYVSDTQNHCIKVIDSLTSNLLEQWGTQGSGQGEFELPTGIAVDDITGNVYVCDAGNYRIQQLDADGNFIRQWGSNGAGNGQFDILNGIAINSLGWVYVVDSGNGRVQVFNSEGVFISKWDVPPEEDDDSVFYNIRDIAIDNCNDVYLCKENVYMGYGDKILKFNSNGTFVLSWIPATQHNNAGYVADTTGITIDSNGNVVLATIDGIYISGFGYYPHSTVQFYSSTGTLLRYLQDTEQSVTRGIAADREGDVYTSAPTLNKIRKFTDNGSLLYEWRSSGELPGEFNQPSDICLRDDGHIYVADYINDRIQEFDENFNFIEEQEVSSPFNIYYDEGIWTAPGDISVDNINDKRYVCDGGLKIYKKGSGLPMATWTEEGTGVLHPRNIEVVDSNSIFISDQDNNRIIEIDGSGKIIGWINSYGSSSEYLNMPRGMARDSLGNLYVTDSYNYEIKKFDTQGNFILAWGQSGGDPGEFTSPDEIRIDSQDFIYVLDGSQGIIKKFDSNGNFIMQWAIIEGYLGTPYHMTMDKNNYIYATIFDQNIVVKFDENGNKLLQWGRVW